MNLPEAIVCTFLSVGPALRFAKTLKEVKTKTAASADSPKNIEIRARPLLRNFSEFMCSWVLDRLVQVAMRAKVQPRINELKEDKKAI